MTSFHKCAGALCVAAGVVLSAACSRQSPAAGPEYQLTATIKDIMDSTVDPSADALWDSVATIVSDAGIEERAPRTDEEWRDVRRAAIRLVEASNLLQMPGRRVAKPGEKSENPGIESGPEEIEAAIQKDIESWRKLARGLHDAVAPAVAAIDARNAQKLSEVGGEIDVACETCHLKYWYPSQEAVLKAIQSGAASPSRSR